MSSTDTTSESVEPMPDFLASRGPIEAAPEAEALGLTGESRTPQKEAPATFDFRNTILLTPTEQRKLRLHQDEFAQSASARLSIHLRAEYELRVTGFQTVVFQKLARGWTNPTHLSMFKMDPLRGVSVLEISNQLGCAMVDRLMGGPGQAPAQPQEISEIEKVLLEQTVQVFLEEWCGSWSRLKELKPAILGYESNGGYIQSIPAETMMLVIAMEAGFGECKGEIQLAVPFAAMEPLIHRLCQDAAGAAAASASPVASPTAPVPLKWNNCFNEVGVTVTAEWDGLEMTARDILALKVGDTIPLTGKNLQYVNIKVADALRFQGRPGTIAGQWAVELTRVIPQ